LDYRRQYVSTSSGLRRKEVTFPASNPVHRRMTDTRRAALGWPAETTPDVDSRVARPYKGQHWPGPKGMRVFDVETYHFHRIAHEGGPPRRQECALPPAVRTKKTNHTRRHKQAERPVLQVQVTPGRNSAWRKSTMVTVNYSGWTPGRQVGRQLPSFKGSDQLFGFNEDNDFKGGREGCGS